MDWPTALASLSGILLCAALAFLCAVFLWSIVEITRIVLNHRQRMALIVRGMHPDLPAGAPGDGSAGISRGGEVGSSSDQALP